MASAGYPAKARVADVITGQATNAEADSGTTAEVVVFHAGTAIKDGKLVTAGGRVLCVSALGDTVDAARTKAYERVAQIEFDGAQYRGDIAWRAMAK
jgi:phosphoribosylamine--glycine ligase